MTLLATPESTVVSGRSLGLAGIPSGHYWTPPHASLTSNTRGNGNLYLTPMHVSAALELAALLFETTVSGSVGAVTRLGIWKAQIDQRPGALLLDAGAVDSTVAAGVIETAITQVLVPGLYYLGAALQGAPATPPTYRITASTQAYGLTGSVAAPLFLGSVCGYQVVGQTGAFADLTAATFSPNGSCIVVGVKGA